MMKRKLICLNLSLLLLALLFISPIASGQDSLPEEMRAADPSVYAVGGAYEQKAAEKAALAETGSGPLLQQESYLISVGNTSFYSDQEKSGTGWSYDPTRQRLTLTDYKGSSIRASGDLYIYSYGTSKITGAKSTLSGGTGINVSGGLDVYVMDGKLEVIGGSAEKYGGDGISCSGFLWIYVTGEAQLTCTGGPQTSSSTPSGYGGDGIYAWSVYLFGSGTCNSTGGRAASSTGYGGCAINGGRVTCNLDGTYTGGYGKTVGPAVYFSNECSFGAANIDLHAGGSGSGRYALSGGQNAKLYFSLHTNEEWTNNSDIKIRVNRYNLLLMGNGGKRNGATYTSLTDYYPTWYTLSDYLFTRPGYQQVAWYNPASGDLFPLNEDYLPRQNISLEARWLEVENGDIVCNGLSGRFANGEMYRKYSSDVVLPSAMTYYNSSLLAWSTEMDLINNASDGTFQGVWYDRGGRVAPDPAGVLTLYAHDDMGAYVKYHADGGTFAAGGDLMVQGTSTTATDLQMYALPGSVLTPPEGFRFLGWAYSSGKKTADVKGRESVTCPADSVMDLYPVWEQIVFTESPDEGVDMEYQLDKGEISVEFSREWCERNEAATVIVVGYDPDRDGKMTGAAMDLCGEDGADVTLTLRPEQTCSLKIITLKSGYIPSRAAFELGEVDQFFGVD